MVKPSWGPDLRVQKVGSFEKDSMVLDLQHARHVASRACAFARIDAVVDLVTSVAHNAFKCSALVGMIAAAEAATIGALLYQFSTSIGVGT